MSSNEERKYGAIKAFVATAADAGNCNSVQISKLYRFMDIDEDETGLDIVYSTVEELHEPLFISPWELMYRVKRCNCYASPTEVIPKEQRKLIVPLDIFF